MKIITNSNVICKKIYNFAVAKIGFASEMKTNHFVYCFASHSACTSTIPTTA